MNSISGKRPNILFAISDDQSWPFAGAYDCRTVNTPAFDRIAREGVLFTNAFCPAPQCSPSRAAILTGRNIWQLEEAGTHSSLFPHKFPVYTETLEREGYFVGYTGKGWGPGNWKDGGFSRNPAGPVYNDRRCTPPTDAISECDYAANFEDFLLSRPPEQPFCFWFGCREPHRAYEKGSGLRFGKSTDDVEVPPFLPDTEEIRSDLLDYSVEIEWFDSHLGRMLSLLENLGELDHTLIVVTSDNGMPFPRAKANLYEYSTHVPLAIRWGNAVTEGVVSDALVSLIDLAPTFLEAAGLPPSTESSGQSLIPILMSRDGTSPHREFVITGRERHSHAREDNLGYPSRAIRTHGYLYILNLAPERWPAGNPDTYYDIDGSPTLTYMKAHRREAAVSELFRQSVGKRPLEELYDLSEDPGCLRNMANLPQYADLKNKLRGQLARILAEQLDPRMLGKGDIFESYPRFGPMRPELGGFAEEGQSNPKYLKP